MTIIIIGGKSFILTPQESPEEFDLYHVDKACGDELFEALRRVCPYVEIDKSRKNVPALIESCYINPGTAELEPTENLATEASDGTPDVEDMNARSV